MNEIQRILLAAHESLVGEVFPSLSAVDIVYGQSFVKFLFFLSTRPTEDDLECMSVIETEMLAHFVDLDVSSEFILGLPPEKRGEICIFQRRKESEKSQPELTTAEAELKDPLERFIRILDACWHDVVGDSGYSSTGNSSLRAPCPTTTPLFWSPTVKVQKLRAFAFTICNVHLRTESAVDQRKVMGLEI